MTFFEKVKQLWISLRLERNPYYYYTIDIQDAINKLHHVMTEHKLSRPEMKDATLYITTLRDYKRIISAKTGRSNTHELDHILNEIHLTMNSVDKFIKKVHDEDHDHDVAIK